MKIGARILGSRLNKSFGSSCPKSSFQTPDPCIKVYFNILGVHQIFLWILDKKSICLKTGSRVLDLWLCKSFGPNWPKSSCQAPDSWVKIFSYILGVHQIFLWTLDKMLLISKIRGKILELQFGKSFGPNWPKTSFQTLGPQLMVCSNIQVNILSNFKNYA